MKKLFLGLIAAVIVSTGIFTFAGCEKEEENAPPTNLIKAHTILNTYYDATLIQEFMQTQLLVSI